MEKLGLDKFCGRWEERIEYPGLELYRQRARKLSFFEVFTAVFSAKHCFQATDPRDVIFGVLGLVQIWHPGQTRIVPDYSLSCRMVYTNITLDLLDCGWVNVFRLAAAPKSRTDLPSWVPDFSKRSAPQVAANAPPNVHDGTCSYTMDQNGRHVLEVDGTSYGPISCVGLRCMTRPGGQEKNLVSDLIKMNRRHVIHTYFSGLADFFGHCFSTTEEAHYQLYMLSAAIMHGNLAGCRHDPQTDFTLYDKGYYLPGHPGSEWNLALYVRDIITKPEILDELPLYDMTLDTQRDLAEGRHALSNDPTPLCYDDGPVTLATLSRALSFFGTCHLNCEPFVAGDFCVGSAMKSIKGGDMLVKLNLDPTTLYIIRRVDCDTEDESEDAEDDLEGGLWELVSVAFVPRFWTQKDFPEGKPMVFRLC